MTPNQQQLCDHGFMEAECLKYLLNSLLSLLKLYLQPSRFAERLMKEMVYERNI